MRKTIIAGLALALGFAGSAGAQTVVNADITANTTWGVAPNPCPIILQRPIFVTNNATLTILQGCVVRGQPRSGPVIPGNTAGSPGALIVTRNGRINAQGTPVAPIIMTTAAVDNNGDNVPDDDDSNGFEDAWQPGDAFYDDTPATQPLAPLNAAGDANVALWGGLVILGNAPTNLSNVAGLDFGEGIVEGLTVPGFPAANAAYGGLDPHDNSGTVRYVSVRHAGDEIGEGNELNGVTLAGVGDATTFENVEVYANFDDGMEWFGGTVNGRNLTVAFAGDDTFDLDQGYTGVNQFLFGVMPFFNENDGGAFGSASGDKGGEWDGDDFDEPGSNVNLVGPSNAPWPLSAPVMLNVTIIGSTPNVTNPATSPASANRGIQMRNGFAGQLRNSIIVNTGTAQGFDVDGGGAPGFTVLDNFNNGLVQVCASTFDDGAALPASPEQAILNGCPGNVVNAAGFPNLVNEDTTFVPTGNAANKLVPSLKPTPTNPRPNNGLTGIAGGVVATEPGTDPTATYRGAFARTAPVLWTTDWTVLNIAGLLAD